MNALTLRLEEDAARVRRTRVERRPTLVFPLDTSVIRLDWGDGARRLDRAWFALLPARLAYELEPLGSTVKAATLGLGEGAERAVAREYAADFSPRLFARIVAEPRLFVRTRWVDELVQRYLFERTVCERHDSAAAAFLETELTKELFFLGKEQLEQLERPSLFEEESDLVARARAWLEARLFERVGMDALVAHCGASESTLYRAFRRAHGLAPSEYVRERRLDEALLLLESGRYSVSEVALRVGYANLSAFTVAFRRRFGSAPSALRKKEAAARLPPHGKPPRRRRERD